MFFFLKSYYESSMPSNFLQRYFCCRAIVLKMLLLWGVLSSAGVVHYWIHWLAQKERSLFLRVASKSTEITTLLQMFGCIPFVYLELKLNGSIGKIIYISKVNKLINKNCTTSVSENNLKRYNKEIEILESSATFCFKTQFMGRTVGNQFYRTKTKGFIF